MQLRLWREEKTVKYFLKTSLGFLSLYVSAGLILS
jgi:hypothetical protein